MLGMKTIFGNKSEKFSKYLNKTNYFGPKFMYMNNELRTVKYFQNNGGLCEFLLTLGF